MKMFSNLVLGAAVTYFICRLWQYCELTFYGEVQTSAVDTIITLIWVLVMMAAYFKGWLDNRYCHEAKDDPMDAKVMQARAMLIEAEARKTAAEAARIEAENAAKATDAEVRKIQALARKTEAEAQEIALKNKREGSQ